MHGAHSLAHWSSTQSTVAGSSGEAELNAINKGVSETIGLVDLIKDLNDWMTSREYVSVDEMIGSMSQKAVPNPAAFERALYLKELQSYKLG